MKSVKKNGIILSMSIIILLFWTTGVFAAAPGTEDFGVAYRGHVQDKGDMPKPVGTMVSGPEALGTRGESLRVEGFWIELTGDVPEGAGITYQVHVQNEGWMEPVKDGKFAGTAGESQRIEAIKISLDNLSGYDVYYRGHVQNQGDIPQIKGEWGWVKNGEQLGTTGSSLRLEELQIKIVKKADVTYTKAGTYGPKTGVEVVNTNIVITKPNVTLQNMTIKGDLTIGEGVGEGNVTLNNVTVEGDTFVRGGGKNSIHINGGSYNKITVQQTSSGQVRIVATNADGLEVVISEDAKGEAIILEGDFEDVQVDAPDVKISTQGDTTIKQMNLGETAKGSEVTFETNTKVENLVLDADVDVKGQGTVEKAAVNSDGITFEKAPIKQDVDPGVVTPPVVTPPVVTPPVVPTPTPGGGGGGGGGTGTPTATAITGISITGDQNVGSTLTATPSPTDATGTYQWMRCTTATGTYEAIIGATSNTYVLQSTDATKFIKVVITGNGNYTGTQTSVATSAITSLKEITAYTSLTSITLSSNENLTDLASLKASSKLPTQVTVTDGSTPVSATITNWTGTFDGTTTGAKTLTAVWTMPTGYRDQTAPITVSITVNVNTAQTAVPSSAKVITGTTIGTVDGGGNIVGVPVGTKVSALKTALTLSTGATCEIMASSDPGALAVADQVNTNVTGTMVIKVTAQNNSTATYTIAMASVVKSTTPTANIKTVAKTSATQATVDFTLTSSHTSGTWKVYSNSDCTTLKTDVTATLTGSTLTLSSSGTDVEAAIYYIVWNDGTNADSNALALTVGAHEENLVAVVNNVRFEALDGTSTIYFDQPANKTGIQNYQIMFSSDNGQNWDYTAQPAITNEATLSLDMTGVAINLNETKAFNKVKVVSGIAENSGYQQNEASFPINFTVTKEGSELAVVVARNQANDVELTLPGNATDDETYAVRIFGPSGVGSSSTITFKGSQINNNVITMSHATQPISGLSEGAIFKVCKTSNCTLTGLSVTPLQGTGVTIKPYPVEWADSAITTIPTNNNNPPYQLMQINYKRNEAVTSSQMTISMKTPADGDVANDTILWKSTGGTSQNDSAFWQWSYRDAHSVFDGNGTLDTTSQEDLDSIERSNDHQLKAGSVITIKIDVVKDTKTYSITKDYTITAEDVTNSAYNSPPPASSDAKVITATSVGTLDAGNITAVLAGTKVKALKDGLTLSANATCEIMATNAPDALAVSDQENTNVTGTMVIKVTAQNGSSTSYSITMASSLDAPTNLQAAAGNGTATLQWDASANAESYKVYQSTASGSGYSEIANAVTTTTYNATGLTPGQTYYFVVKAVATGYNDSPNSLEVSAIANVSPSGSEISGNQLIISNESTDLATQSTGTLSSIITPPMNELNTEGMEGPIRINPEIPFRNSPDQSTLDASMIPSISSSGLNDVKNFYTYNYTTTNYDTTTAHCAYIGENVEVWVENNAVPVQLTDSEATTIGQEFDNNIYGLVTTNFFAASDVDNNDKIDILCYDIKDGYTGGGYIGGYYDPNNQLAGANSNQMDMIFVDTNPLIGIEKNLPKSYSTLAHELQHLVNFNCNQAQTGQMATWLNESLSQAAEQMYNGVQTNRITYFNNSTVIADGRSVMDWNQADSLPNYSLSYLFGQYLRTQAEQKLDAGVKTDIFKQILADPGNETTALTNAIHTNIDPNLSLGKVLTNFRVATALKATTGVYGFGKDAAAFSSISPKVSTLTSADLKGGGAIIKNISAGPFTVPTVHGNNVTYTGIY